MAEYSNPFFGQANPFMGKDNPYLTDKINAAQGDLARNYNLTTQPAYNTAMAKSGSFGNAGVQQMNENAQLNLQKSMGDISTNMRGQDYDSQKQMYMQDRGQNIQNYQWDQGFNRDLYNDAYTQNMNNLTTGVGLLGTLNGYNQQDLQNGTNIQNTPYNYWSQFANSANSMGQGYGTTTSSLGTSSSPLTSALGGAQLASSLWGKYQNSNNYGSSGNNYNGSSSDPYAANYTNSMDQGIVW